MKKSYYYEFAIVVIISLLIIFSTFIIEKSLEKYQLLKSAANNGTLIVIQPQSNYSTLQEEITSLKRVLRMIYLKVQQLDVKVSNLSQQVANLKPVYQHTVIKEIYNYSYVYSYKLDEKKLDLLLQYVESRCYAKNCQEIDSILYQLSTNSWLTQRFPRVAAKLKGDLLVLKHFAAERDYSNKDMLLLALNDTAAIASFLDTVDAPETHELAFKLFSIVASICRSYNKVLTCAYVIYLPGQQINTSQYDLVVKFNLENVDKSPYLAYLVKEYNVTTTPYYISF
jgi:hypothetical protein